MIGDSTITEMRQYNARKRKTASVHYTECQRIELVTDQLSQLQLNANFEN